MEDNYDSLVEQCLNKWGTEDARILDFKNQFSAWVYQMQDSLKIIVLDLLQDFVYYSHENTNQKLIELHNDLLNTGAITNDNTVFCVIPAKLKTSNSSYDYWSEYKLLNKMSKHCLVPNIEALDDEDISNIDNFVFVDDCSGSGKTFIDYMKLVKNRLSNKNIYYIVIHAMKNAIENINKFSEENNLKVDIICSTIQIKAFDSERYTGTDTKHVFNSECKKIGIPRHEILGFKKSQSLLAFHNNTPNNTLGIFRYDTENYKSIFPRNDDEKPSWYRMKIEREMRNKQNYYAKKGALRDG